MIHGIVRIQSYHGYDEFECFCKLIFGSYEDYKLHEQGIKVQPVMKDRWKYVGV